MKSEDRTEVEESGSQGIGAVSKKGYYVILPPLHGDFPAPVSAPLPAPVIAVATPAPVKIMKPNLGAGRAHVTNFDDMGLGQTKNAASPESIVQHKSKVLAPARTVSEITPQVTVHHPTKVSIKTVAAPAKKSRFPGWLFG